MMMSLKSSRVRLTGDLPGARTVWRNHPDIMKWCRQRTLLSSAEDTEWEEKQASDPTIKMFGIMDDELMRMVGVCGLTSIDLYNRSAEFSLYIGPEHQRKGYAREALGELLRIGFEDFGLNRIWGESFEGNPAVELFFDVGFIAEGKLFQSYYKGGKFINSIIFGLLRSRWDERQRNISTDKSSINSVEPGVCSAGGTNCENGGHSDGYGSDWILR